MQTLDLIGQYDCVDMSLQLAAKQNIKSDWSAQLHSYTFCGKFVM